MSAQTDSIISKLNAAVTDAQGIATWVPPGGGGSPSWPTATDCLGGTVPSQMGIPPGDGDPTGYQGEPGRTRRLATMPAGSIGIFGDSIIQMMHENRMHTAAVNYALGGQSLRRMVNALPSFTFMRSAGAGVILCGVNDLSNIENYGSRDNHNATQTVLQSMFSGKLKPYLTGKWVICHLLPCDEAFAGSGATGYNAQVAEVNAGLSAAMSGCAATIEYLPVNASWVDGSGNLKDEYHIDGQHPSSAFCRIYEDAVRAKLTALGL